MKCCDVLEDHDASEIVTRPIGDHASSWAQWPESGRNAVQPVDHSDNLSRFMGSETLLSAHFCTAAASSTGNKLVQGASSLTGSSGLPSFTRCVIVSPLDTVAAWASSDVALNIRKSPVACARGLLYDKGNASPARAYPSFEQRSEMNHKRLLWTLEYSFFLEGFSSPILPPLTTTLRTLLRTLTGLGTPEHVHAKTSLSTVLFFLAIMASGRALSSPLDFL